MDKQVALKKAMALCSRSEHCLSDIKYKLLEWEAEEMESILENLIENKFIDENRFTRAFVNDKYKFNRWGKTKIAYMLRQKAVPSPIILACLNEIPEEEYMNIAKEVFSAKIKQTKAPDKYSLKTKLYRFMASRGFESFIIQECFAIEGLQDNNE